MGIAPHFALLFLDLDRFKWVNDSIGHAAGDQMLVEVARRLVGLVRGEDVVARLGGDEFALLVHSDRGSNAAMELGRRLLKALEACTTVNGCRLPGLSPHAPYTLNSSLLPDIAAAADQMQLPLSLHLVGRVSARRLAIAARPGLSAATTSTM